MRKQQAMAKRMLKPILAFAICMLPLSLAAQNKDNIYAIKARVEPYVEKVCAQNDWLLSRLQMFWKSHATDIYINGERFDHVSGHAPVPTVRMDGTRGTETSYNAPRLEDVLPYDDDDEGNLTYINRATGKMEKANPAKTGRATGSLNRRILAIARDAAKVYAATGEERYAEMAAGVFDTYMKGIRYRNVPYDLNHGHQQTLVGLTSFEVIHEDAVRETTETYQLLRSYLKKNGYPLDTYEEGFRRWAENIVANGVPHNNWNLFQAGFIVRIALALQHDRAYTDGKGREHYLDLVVNQSSIRQWSLKKMASNCFDANTGIWYESPGYSVNVVGDFAELADMLDENAGIDVFKEIPVIKKAVFALPQYLYPNRMICGFGDTHPGYLATRAVDHLLAYAKRHGYTQMYDSLKSLRQDISPQAEQGKIERRVAQTFYSPNVAWAIQRSGMNPNNSLAVSINGSLGNHQHANGISMELYGKGFALAPDAGIGQYLYSGLDYAEYYSQFPAHNTVCVDGASAYPVMMSRHGIELKKLFPPHGSQIGTSRYSFSHVYFHEPETDADQLRTNGIVTTDKGGYYVDIFRSRRRDGKDKMHDYFYHSLGQRMTLSCADGDTLPLRPTEELAFAGGYLNAYSYIYNKKSATTSKDVKATFIITTAKPSPISMTMWMRGDGPREVFSALSPANMEYERIKNMPYDVRHQPVPTFVARQHGEAWLHPFVAVFEPSSAQEPSQIKAVTFFKPESTSPTALGIKVELKSGRTDYIFSSAEEAQMSYAGFTVKAVYDVRSR